MSMHGRWLSSWIATNASWRHGPEPHTARTSGEIAIKTPGAAAAEEEEDQEAAAAAVATDVSRDTRVGAEDDGATTAGITDGTTALAAAVAGEDRGGPVVVAATEGRGIREGDRF